MTDGGLKNTYITLYENGNIQQDGCATSNISHKFVGKTYMPSLSKETLKIPSNISLSIGSITADNTGIMFMNSLAAESYTYSSNIGLKRR